jgi:hypothetical protein
MNPFAGKSPTERNKIIAAMVLGVLFAVFAVARVRRSFSAANRINSQHFADAAIVSVTGANSAISDADGERARFTLFNDTDKLLPDKFYAPDAGRNIFAF